VAGGFTGRVIGAYAAAGTIHIDWFDYEPLEPDPPHPSVEAAEAILAP
jgi:hypothetical protein